MPCATRCSSSLTTTCRLRLMVDAAKPSRTVRSSVVELACGFEGDDADGDAEVEALGFAARGDRDGSARQRHHVTRKALALTTEEQQVVVAENEVGQLGGGVFCNRGDY